MGAIHQPWPVKLIMPMFTGEEGLFTRAEEILCETYGPVDYVSGELAFDHTDYYRDEFGAGLRRKFLAFEQLIDPGQLAAIKRHTNDIERMLGSDEGRRINLDPGYLSGAKLVLASTKNHSHRIYLAQGIYAEVTLIYRGGAFGTLPWTYPDYASEPYLEILRAIRSIYLEQLAVLRRQGALDIR
jgi:hypothetical protein